MKPPTSNTSTNKTQPSTFVVGNVSIDTTTGQATVSKPVPAKPTPVTMPSGITINPQSGQVIKPATTYIPGFGDVDVKTGVNVSVVENKNSNKPMEPPPPVRTNRDGSMGCNYYYEVIDDSIDKVRDHNQNYYDETIPEYTIKQNLLTKQDHYRDRKEYTGIKGVVVHWTASPNASPLGVFNYFENGKDASAHYVVGSTGTEVWQLVPDDQTAHASAIGDTKYQKYYTKLVTDSFIGPSGTRRINDWTIAIETNPIDSSGNFNNETYTTLVRLTADKLLEYNLDVEMGLYRHADFTTKDCPKIFTNPWETWKAYQYPDPVDPTGQTMITAGVKPTFNANWEYFKRDVDKAMHRKK